MFGIELFIQMIKFFFRCVRQKIWPKAALLVLGGGNGIVDSDYSTLQWRHNRRWRLKSPASRLFTQPFIQGEDQRKHQNFASLAFFGEFTGDRWIPRTKGQERKMFPFDDVIIKCYDDSLSNMRVKMETLGSDLLAQGHFVRLHLTMINQT